LVDMASRSFLFSMQGKTVLEVGAAYGNILLKSLDLGFTYYVVNDLDPRHLFIAASRTWEEINRKSLRADILDQISLSKTTAPENLIKSIQI
jgi:hypothetical protein